MSLADRPTWGISLRILSGILGAGMYISVKAVSEDVPLGWGVYSALAIRENRISRPVDFRVPFNWRGPRILVLGSYPPSNVLKDGPAINSQIERPGS